MTETAPEIRVQPFDQHNRKLVENVHPTAWTNPTPPARYNLVAVGAGTGGLISAAGAAAFGARVALVERHLMGGDCLNVGCVPSKGVIRAARAWHEVAHVGTFGLKATLDTRDFGAVMERVRRIRAHISEVDSAQRYLGLGVDVFLGNARFVGPDALEVDGQRLRFRRAVIATGGHPVAPPIPGLEEAGYLTNETIFTLTELPARLVVIGAGPIGCEMAQSFARFGSRVTILDAGQHVLPREDPDAAAIIAGALRRDGVTYEASITVTRVDMRGGSREVRFERDGVEHTIVADQILVAAGRAPNIEGLGLEAAGVETNRRGVVVNDFLQTTNRRIFAAGDVAGMHLFTHAAHAHASIAVQNALFGSLLPPPFGRARASRLVMPWCTYTSPEIAHVGMYEGDARQRGIEVDTITVPLSEVDRALLDGEDEGFLRVHLKKSTDRVLGATLVAEHAGEMIGELCLAITTGIGLGKIAATIHPYPTQGEVIRRVADVWRRTKLTPRVRRVTQTILRWVA